MRIERRDDEDDDDDDDGTVKNKESMICVKAVRPEIDSTICLVWRCDDVVENVRRKSPRHCS
jgi:hypothetical protein